MGSLPKLNVRYFDDFEVGDVIVSPGRTITVADIVNFAGFSGDWHPLHTDEEFASKSIFGMRIAHGMLCLSVITGLMMRSGIAEETATGLLNVEWDFIAPVKEGDTIRVHFKIIEKNETKKDDRGVIRYQVQMINQNNDIVGEGFLSNLYFRRV